LIVPEILTDALRFKAGENKMGADEANALSKAIIDLLNRGTATREALVALADAAALVIRQRFEPKHHVETVEWFASLVKDQIKSEWQSGRTSPHV
jgi:hypothetical protein